MKIFKYTILSLFAVAVLASCGDDDDNGNVVAADPICSDGIQNQGETGFDCGGPCTTTCPGIKIGSNDIRILDEFNH